LLIDTFTASRILSNGDSKLGNKLAEVADRYLGIELRKDQRRSDWGARMLLAEQIQYAAQDVEHLHALKEKLDAELKAAALMGVLRLEMDLLPVVVEMELIGFCVDRKMEYRKWKKLKEDVESHIHEIRPDSRIHGQFNPLGTDTGRFSSSEPNMQNITRG
jgi:DNA polymerase I-like protein with 3'-5' exonuclease and polymerase domains